MNNYDKSPIRFIAPSDFITKEPFSTLFSHNKAMVTSISATMKKDGYDLAYPVVCSEVGGFVVDGHTRIASAKKAGLKLIPFINRKFTDDDDALKYAISCQRNRRNLTDAELIKCVEELDKRKTKAEAGKSGRDKQLGQAQGCASPEPEGKSSSATAELLNVSPRQVEKIRSIIDNAPKEIKEAVSSGEMSINQAEKEIRHQKETTERQADNSKYIRVSFAPILFKSELSVTEAQKAAEVEFIKIIRSMTDKEILARSKVELTDKSKYDAFCAFQKRI